MFSSPLVMDLSQIASPILASLPLSILWWVLAFVLVLLSLGLILIILIQDPKGGGLSSAFGGGPGGESILGAKAQQGVTRFTGIMTAVFAAIVLIMVLIDNHFLAQTSVAATGAGEATLEADAGEDDTGTDDGSAPAPPGTLPPGLAPPRIPSPIPQTPAPGAPTPTTTPPTTTPPPQPSTETSEGQ